MKLLVNKAFQDLKRAPTMAPALSFLDYHYPFHWHIHERHGFATGILVQKHACHYCPIAYYSSFISTLIRLIDTDDQHNCVATIDVYIYKARPIADTNTEFGCGSLY
ncbi:hypothetical protein PAMP_004304 [Pampus punctatissimus]